MCEMTNNRETLEQNIVGETYICFKNYSIIRLTNVYNSDKFKIEIIAAKNEK